MLKAYKYRIYPNKAQVKAFSKAFGHNRFVWNHMLALKKRYYSILGKSLSKRQIQDHLVKLKKRDKFSWMKEVNSQSLLATLDNLDKAYNRFFKHQAKFPRFKSKKGNWHSFANPQHTDIDFDSGLVKLPKVGWVKAKFHREFSGKIKTSTVKLSPSGKYTVSILVDDGQALPDKTIIEPSHSIGIDLGIKDLVITSESQVFENKHILKNKQSLLKRHQRILSRKTKNSIARTKKRIKVAQLHEVIANSRKDYLHKISNSLVSENQATTIFCENLGIKNMIRNRKLSRHIADASWGIFLNFLSYKCERAAKNLISIKRFAPSSRTCNACGAYHSTLTLSDRTFVCFECSHTEDRDINASKNIRDFGLAQELGSGSESPRAVKSTPNSKPDLSGELAKGLALTLIGSAEAPLS